MRATFLSLAEVDGANMSILRRMTHAAPTDVVSGYVRVSWPASCIASAKVGSWPMWVASVSVRVAARLIAFFVYRVSTRFTALSNSIRSASSNRQ